MGFIDAKTIAHGDASDCGGQAHGNGVGLTALGAYFADKMKYPENLSDLVPKYLKQLPADDFHGKNQVHRVGANGKNDGGKLLADEPRGTGDDVGVRPPRK